MQCRQRPANRINVTQHPGLNAGHTLVPDALQQHVSLGQHIGLVTLPIETHVSECTKLLGSQTLWHLLHINVFQQLHTVLETEHSHTFGSAAESTRQRLAA